MARKLIQFVVSRCYRRRHGAVHDELPPDAGADVALEVAIVMDLVQMVPCRGDLHGPRVVVDELPEGCRGTAVFVYGAVAGAAVPLVDHSPCGYDVNRVRDQVDKGPAHGRAVVAKDTAIPAPLIQEASRRGDLRDVGVVVQELPAGERRAIVAQDLAVIMLLIKFVARRDNGRRSQAGVQLVPARLALPV